MASTSGTRVEIRKFDGKNFALWKEMMQDVLIIRRQVKVFRYNETYFNENLNVEIAHSTIWMHLAENVYFNADNILFVGKAIDRLRKIVLLIETHIDSTTIQHEDQRDRSGNDSH